MSDDPPSFTAATGASAVPAATDKSASLIDSQPSAAGSRQATMSISAEKTSSGAAQGSDPAGDVRREVEKEQALADLRKRVAGLEDELAKVKSEKQALETERSGAVSTTGQLRTQLSALQSSFHQTTSELSVLQSRIEAIEREKRELLEEMERLQQRQTRSTQEMYSLRSQKAEASQKIAHLDVEVSELRMAADSAKFNEERATQALQGARAEILTLGQAIADIEERFGKYRADKQSELSNLQIEHDNLFTRLTSAESSLHALQRSYNDTNRRLAEAHANIATLTSAAATTKASHSTEIHRLLEENRILERRAEEARSTIAEREAELERVVNEQEDERAEWEVKFKNEEKRRKAAEKNSEEFQHIVEQMAIARGDGASTDLSPAAALAGGMRESGKSYTQFYLDYTIQEGKLRATENEVARLTDLLDEISQDIAEKKPLLDEQAVEHAAAIDRANALAAELATVMASRDTLDAQVKSLEATQRNREEEVSSLQSTVEDLSRQVQVLLRQVAVLKDPSLANSSISENTSVSEGDIITDHLVEFKSIRALQEQNQKLLKLTRGLMAKLDAREIRRATNEAEDVEIGQNLDQAAETIERLHTQLIEAQKKVNDVSRERDFFSKLLARGEGLKWTNIHGSSSGGAGSGAALDDEADGGSSALAQQTIEGLRAEIDGVRVKAEEDIKAAREEVRQRMEERGKAEVAQARAEAKVQMLEEQMKTMNDTAALQKQQFDGLESQRHQLQATVSQLQNERRSALEQAAARQSEVDRLRAECTNLRTEREQFRGVEARLQADFRTVQEERARLQQLIENLQGIAAENERTKVEERERLEKRIDELQREAIALRRQVEQAQAVTRAAEGKVNDFDSRLATATAAVRAEKEASDALAASRAEEIGTLKASLASAEAATEKMKNIGLNWKRRTESLDTQYKAERSTHQEAIDAKDKELGEVRSEIERIQGELETARTELRDAQKHLEESRRAEALKEGTVQRLQSELNPARSQKPGAAGAAAPAHDDAALKALQAERDSLQQRVTQLEQELAAAKAAVPAGGEGSAATSPDVAELQSKYDALLKEKEQWDETYENNVRKVNRANASMKNHLDSIRKDQSTWLEERKQLKSQLEEARANSAATGTEGGADAQPSQAAIDEAVKAAVAAREAELAEAHRVALEQVRAGAASGSSDQAVVDAAVKQKEAELTAKYEAQLSELRAQQAGSSTSAPEDVSKLHNEVAELKDKVNALSRQLKTAEISRKTLDRQKAELENKVKKLEGGVAASTAATPAPASAAAAPGLSVSASEFMPGTGALATGEAGGSAPAAAASGATAGPSVRGSAVRGRGRGAARGTGRGGAVLSAVNATLAAATPAAGTSGAKRPLPEDGEIADAGSSSTGATETGQADATEGGVAPATGVLASIRGAAGGGARILKRPRGAGPGRGGAAGAAGRGGATTRRASAQGAAAPGGALAQGGAGGPAGGDTGGDAGAGGAGAGGSST